MDIQTPSSPPLRAWRAVVNTGKDASAWPRKKRPDLVLMTSASKATWTASRPPRRSAAVQDPRRLPDGLLRPATSSAPSSTAALRLHSSSLRERLAPHHHQWSLHNTHASAWSDHLDGGVELVFLEGLEEVAVGLRELGALDGGRSE